ncbi:vacuolar protein sorting-associated protein 41 homolog [Cimex lectularius]|uniref:RING-type domain-containing protein n=1 Tax=Cimex lectularius TaxID=79782 RepID=A0A8I6RAG6_CIMLE|nr:vacuolar protein sorting-associated protein 41 homolog [Cimex lectularius]
MDDNSSNKSDEHLEEDEGSDLDEKEPKLKYMRMGNGVENILKADSASCVAIHPKFVCIGTDWGLIYFLDHQGNVVLDKELRAHTLAVNQISIDANGDYIASCADDGKVYVFGVYDSDNNQEIRLERLVRSVAIDPLYAKGGSYRRVITGDEKLVLHEKGFFSRIRSTVLGDASIEGGVKNIKWSPDGKLLAWSTQVGFRVYDVDVKTSLGLVKWASKPQIDLKCPMCWEGNNNLVVAWNNTIKICAIKRKTTATPSHISAFVVMPVYTIQMEYIVSGVGPWGNMLVVLGCTKEINNSGLDGDRPQLQVIEPTSSGYEDLNSHFLSLRGFEKYAASDYSLECLPDEGQFVIVSPRDIVVACPYDADDRIDWLINHSKFEMAQKAVADSKVPFVRHSKYSVGREYIGYLLKKREYKKAADQCKNILGNDKMKWEKELRRFAEHQAAHALADYVPISLECRLPNHCYELILYEYLRYDKEGFLNKIKAWPPALYDPSTMGAVVLKCIFGSDLKSNPTLLEALAIIYSHMGNHDKALSMYIKLQNNGVFNLIEQHKLHSSIHKSAKDLMKMDENKAIRTFLHSNVNPDDIVEALKDHNYYCFKYLDALNKHDSKACIKNHSKLVRLYADFEPDKLLNFLKMSDHYAIREALDICKSGKLNEEMVYLLGRIGNTKEALELILTSIGDIERAIDFCKEHDDEELWEDLISFSLDKPMCITNLLQNIGTYVDPNILLQKIDNKLPIPSLKESLVKLMQGYNLQVQVQEGCNVILANDSFALSEKVRSIRQRGVLIGDDQQCGSCHKKVILKSTKDSNVKESLVIFHCNHIFHRDCLPAFMDNCKLCTKTKLHF